MNIPWKPINTVSELSDEAHVVLYHPTAFASNVLPYTLSNAEWAKRKAEARGYTKYLILYEE